MNDVKPAWQSKSMWGGVIALVALTLQTSGIVDVSAEDQETITHILVEMIEYAGVLLAIWGRYVARAEIEW